MMRYKVPQNVQRADQILWFFTLKQLIIVAVGGGISYVLFLTIKKNFEVNELETVLIFLPAALSAAFAFVKINGLTLFQLILLIIEQGFFRPGRRSWSPHGGDVFRSLTRTNTRKENEKAAATVEKDYSQGTVNDLASLVDRK